MSKMATDTNRIVYDDLLCFLRNPFFHIPVITFMEAHCLIFDPNTDDRPEYRAVHREYKKLIGDLLEGFIADSDINQAQLITALNDMNAKPDLKEIFQSSFEQVLAMDDYGIFVRLMTQKNVELQQQALLMILQMTGHVPDSLQLGEKASKKKESSVEEEDAIMNKVLEQSKREYDAMQRKMNKENEEVQAIIIVSQNDFARLQQEKEEEEKRLKEAMMNLSVEEAVSGSKPPSGGQRNKPPIVSGSKAKTKSQTSHSQSKEVPRIVTSPPVAKGGSKQISGSQAAADWLKSAESDVSSSASHKQAVSAAAAAMSGLSPIELQKRQEYLRQQRDKLLEMKKKEREKELLSAERKQPERPMSARAARSALAKGQQKPGKESKANPEDERKQAMRKAIADRLKAEVIVTLYQPGSYHVDDRFTGGGSWHPWCEPPSSYDHLPASQRHAQHRQG